MRTKAARECRNRIGAWLVAGMALLFTPAQAEVQQPDAGQQRGAGEAGGRPVGGVRRGHRDQVLHAGRQVG